MHNMLNRKILESKATLGACLLEVASSELEKDKTGVFLHNCTGSIIIIAIVITHYRIRDV